jgi:hypothetical protein
MLFFARSDRFEDPFEGSMPTQNPTVLRAYLAQAAPGIQEEHLDQFSKFRQGIRSRMYLNCWHMNEHESAAMWKLYARTNEAIAIRSSYDALRTCLPDDGPHVYIGMLKYIDYSTAIIPEGNAFWPFVHKRLSFAHERELRALIFEDPASEHGQMDFSLQMPIGKQIPVDLGRLITTVYVAPTSPQWFADLVRLVLEGTASPRRSFTPPSMQAQCSKFSAAS